MYLLSKEIRKWRTCRRRKLLISSTMPNQHQPQAVTPLYPTRRSHLIVGRSHFLPYLQPSTGTGFGIHSSNFNIAAPSAVPSLDHPTLPVSGQPIIDTRRFYSPRAEGTLPPPSDLDEADRAGRLSTEDLLSMLLLKVWERRTVLPSEALSFSATSEGFLQPGSCPGAKPVDTSVSVTPEKLA